MKPDYEELLKCLTRIVGDLPTRRDWLDPVLESTARDLIARAEAEPAARYWKKTYPRSCEKWFWKFDGVKMRGRVDETPWENSAYDSPEMLVDEVSNLTETTAAEAEPKP